MHKQEVEKLTESSKYLKLLYVEDSEVARESTLDMLSIFFDNIHVANDGEEGFSAFCNNEYDIIITDLNMPKMNGIEMIYKIRELNQDVVVLVLSAHDNPHYFLETISAGISGYLLKPIDTQQFTDMIKQSIKTINTAKELQEYKKHLEDKVNSQIKKIKENTNAVKEKEKAEELLKMHSDFLANMSHEIRTPLNAILGFIELLLENENDTTKKQYLDVINGSSKNLLNIINDILDLSKIQSGNLPIEYIDFNPKDEFELTKGLFQAKLKEKNIELITNLNELPPSLKGDIFRIKQVINNLLSNAIKFTDDNKHIFLDVAYNDNNLHVSVRDEGIGISDEYQNKIFEAFTQENSSTTRKYGGTGLGLAISYKLIKAMDGELKVKSELNHGSTFYFSLPLKIGNEIQKKSPNNSVQKLKGDILLVEDNKANQMFMKVILKQLGLSFDIVNDGLEAIEAFKKNKYDLILMDESMPNLNGVEATKQIREIEKLQNLEYTTIVALTANAIKGTKERLLAAGMDEYITKPLNKNKLANVLSEFLIVEKAEV